MQEELLRSQEKTSQRTVLSIDQLIQAYSSMDEEQEEIEKKANWMIIPSAESLYRESSVFGMFPLPVGFIFQPFAVESGDCLQVHHPPVRCARCKAVASNLSKVEDHGNWRCAFCTTVSSGPYNNQYININRQINLREEFAELNSEVNTVEFTVDGEMDPSLHSPSSNHRAVIFLIDKSLSAEQFQHIRESLSVIFNDPLCEDYSIGFIVFGDVIEIYELEGRVGEADVYSGTHLPSASDEAYIRRHELLGSDRQFDQEDFYSSYLSPLHDHQQHVLDILATFTMKEEV